MKKILLITVGLLGFIAVFSQDEVNESNSYKLGVQYHQEFVLNGYVQVREWELEGDKMKFWKGLEGKLSLIL